MDGTLANDRSRGEEAAKGSMPPEHATKETANQKAHPVFLNTTQRPGHVVNCPQSEEGREQREINTYVLYLWGLYMIYIGTDT